MKQRLQWRHFVHFFTILFCLGFFSPPSVLKAQTCSGNASSVSSQTGVESSTDITGALNNATARFRETNDVIVVNLGNTLSSGGTLAVTWYADSGSPSVALAASSDNVTFNAMTGSPFSVTNGSMHTLNVTLNQSTRYVRLTLTNATRLEVDGFTYTNQPCSGGCVAGTTAPTLSATTKSNACPATTVDLTTITASNLPASTTLTWHTGTPATTGNKVTGTSVAAATYYAAFFDATNSCYSGTGGNGASTTAVTATVNLCSVNLTLAKTGDRATVMPTQNIIYTLTLTNTGATTATNVSVKDQLPAGVTFVSATPSVGTYNSATGIWLVPTIATGAQTLTITVTAQ